ncbi:hypothetical protein [Metabacillus iocasae]|uniref:Membrane-associated HD superfamily phosphohydrolase n=1 Tax=Priestia iocasae TaxID=2291674 RepID=A0ABS2QUC3_9BACI|nr:hypothetical protein [Metabacillus iocasae]MBM7702592.1 membrane-associated HD superfamily phosphohydrolase [Metabacillus iocasae]
MEFLFPQFITYPYIVLLFVIQVLVLMLNMTFLTHLLLAITLFFIYRLQRLFSLSNLLLASMKPFQDLYFFLLYTVSIFNHVLFAVNGSVFHSQKLFVIVCIIPFYLSFTSLALYVYYQFKKSTIWTLKLCMLTLALYPIVSLLFKWLVTANLLVSLSYLHLAWYANKLYYKHQVR